MIVRTDARNTRALGVAGGLVWTAPRGGLISTDNFRKRVFEPAVKAAGLQPLRFHDLRQTFAALLVESGMGKNPLFVQKTLGHSKIETTFGVHGHLFPSAEDEAKEAFSALIAAHSVPSAYPEARGLMETRVNKGITPPRALKPVTPEVAASIPVAPVFGWLRNVGCRAGSGGFSAANVPGTFDLISADSAHLVSSTYPRLTATWRYVSGERRSAFTLRRSRSNARFAVSPRRRAARSR